MVIVNSDSCKTLVTLDDHDSKCWRATESCDEREGLVDDAPFVPTDLLLPEDDDDCYDTMEFVDEEIYHIPKQQQQRIYLPQQQQQSRSKQPPLPDVDSYLRCIPQLVERADELLANPPRRFSQECNQRIVYVAQAEVAHASSTHCDVLVSDRATTCHILAIRSTTTSALGQPALGSMTHLDSASYDDCVRNMIQQHKSQHFASLPTSGKVKGDHVVAMDVHLLGGYECQSSKSISNWIIHLLAGIAAENKNWLKMTLRTCAISSMNDNGHACPMGRGLGLDLKTGEAFLAKVIDPNLSSPALHVRASRQWTTPNSTTDASSSSHHPLCVIHTFAAPEIRVEPFPLAAVSLTPQQLDLLLKLPDHIMLQLVSTSPHAEEDVEEFCQSIRVTLDFLRHHSVARQVFGMDGNQPLRFHRVGSTNTWEPTVPCSCC